MKLHLGSKSKKIISKNTKNPKKSPIHTVQKKDKYREGLISFNDTQEDKYDKLFEQKLAAQYREFKNIKDYKLQSIKFIRIIIILAVIIVVALLLITFN